MRLPIPDRILDFFPQINPSNDDLSTTDDELNTSSDDESSIGRFVRTAMPVGETPGAGSGSPRKEASATRVLQMPGIDPAFLVNLDKVHKAQAKNKITQKSIAENMIQLDQLRQRAMLGSHVEMTFSLEFTVNAIKQKVNIAELVNMLLAMTRPEKYRTFKKVRELDIGRFVSDTINTFKEAFTHVVSGTKEQYQELLRLVTEETRDELAKTTPEIQDICAGIRKLIAAKIDALPSAVAPDDKSIQVINGMFFWHQWIMGICLHPQRLSVNEELKEFALSLAPTPAIREKLRYELNRFENNFKDRPMEPKPARSFISMLEWFMRHIFILLEGAPGLGKSFLSSLLMEIYDEGRRSVTIPPSTPYLFKPEHMDADPEDKDEIWLKTPRQILGAVAELIALGYAAFRLEEAEKYLLPQMAEVLANSKVSVPAELKHDADPGTDFVRYPFGSFQIPIPLDTVLFAFTTNKKFQEIYGDTYPELFRRFQLVIPYYTATENSLISAYGLGLRRALTLTEDRSLRQAIEKKLKGKEPGTDNPPRIVEGELTGDELQKIVIDVGKKLDTNLAIPDYVGNVTETIIGNLVTDIEENQVSPDNVAAYIDGKKTDLLKSVDGQWQYFYDSLIAKKKDDASASTARSRGYRRAGMLPPPNVNSGDEPPFAMSGHRPVRMRRRAAVEAPSALAMATRQERKSAYVICYEALIEYASGAEDPSQVTEYFRDHDTLNKIVDLFKEKEADANSDGENDGNNSDSALSAIEPEQAGRYFDRQILRDAVKAAYDFYEGNPDSPESVAKPIQAVFTSAREFMDNPSRARGTVNKTIKECRTGLDGPTKFELDKLFFSHDPITRILDWFHALKFATPGILIEVTKNVHRYFMENYEAGNFQDKDSNDVMKELDDAIKTAFEPGRKLNGENLHRENVGPSRKMPFINDLRERRAAESGVPKTLEMHMRMKGTQNGKPKTNVYQGTLVFQKRSEDELFDDGLPGSEKKDLSKSYLQFGEPAQDTN